MKHETLIHELQENSQRIVALVSGVSGAQARWKPGADSWSILEVINHLYDEEREDFRVRLDIILHEPDRGWPPIDPQGWVVSRRYNERDLEESLQLFVAERQSSLAWLKALVEPNWQATYEAPFGPIAAGDMFAAWAAHDLLHMRQLVELHREYLLSLAEPFRLQYAGRW